MEFNSAGDPAHLRLVSVVYEETEFHLKTPALTSGGTYLVCMRGKQAYNFSIKTLGRVAEKPEETGKCALYVTRSVVHGWTVNSQEVEQKYVKTTLSSTEGNNHKNLQGISKSLRKPGNII